MQSFEWKPISQVRALWYAAHRDCTPDRIARPQIVWSRIFALDVDLGHRRAMQEPRINVQGLSVSDAFAGFLVSKHAKTSVSGTRTRMSLFLLVATMTLRARRWSDRANPDRAICLHPHNMRRNTWFVKKKPTFRVNASIVTFAYPLKIRGCVIKVVPKKKILMRSYLH